MAVLPSTPEEEEAFKESACATLGAVFEFRKLFNEYFASYLSAVPAGLFGKLPSDARKHLLRSTRPRVAFQGFSDTLIVYFQAVDNEGRYEWRGIHALLGATATLMPTLLSLGIPLRGGIDLGMGCEFVQGEIYGPVLQSAYQLESKIADYPRIVVGAALADLFDRALRGAHGQRGERLATVTAGQHTHWLSTDLDGVMIVDYLGKSAREMAGKFTNERIVNAREYVSAEHERFSRQRDEKLAGRYRKLACYFDSRLGGKRDSTR